MYCPECGASCKDNAKFCTHCGASFEHKDKESSSPKQPQANPKASQRDVSSAATGAGQPPQPQAAPRSPQPQGTPRPAQPQAAPRPAQPQAASKKPKLSWPLLVGVGAVLVGVVLIVVSLAAGSQGSGGNSVDSKPAPAKLNDGSWTVLVYLCGSNLESDDGYATQNLEEITSVDLPDNVNFLIETGGSNTWHNDVVDADHMNRFRVEDGELVLKDQQPRAPMGSEDTLREFVDWGVQNYPAAHYAIMFWDHGGGSLTGVCMDEMDDDGLVLPEMDRAFAASGVHFDVVGFDTCLMATLENAQMLAKHADYMVGSEEVEPSNGWAYSEWPAWFGDTSNTDDVTSFCETIADTYVQRCKDDGVADAITVSVVDLSKTDDLAKAFVAASESFARATEKSGSFQKLMVRSRDVESYGYANYWDGYTNMVDLGDLMRSVEDQFPNETKAIKDALDQAVILESHGSARNRSTGLSVFYPLVMDDEAYEAYKALSEQLNLGNDAYLQYLSARTGAYDSSEWQGKGIPDLKPLNKESANGAFSYSGLIDDKGAFNVVITGNTEFLQVATYRLGIIQPDGTVVPMGTGNNLDLKIDEHGKVTYTDLFDGALLTVGGAYAYAEIVDMVSEGGKPVYNLFSIPVELTRAKTSGDKITVDENLLVMYDYESNKYLPLCYYEDVDESGMAGKSIIQLRKGDELKFVVAREVNGKIERGTTGKTITLDENTEVKELSPGDATYLYQIVITDIFGTTYDPISAKITFKDGKRTAELI